MNTASSGKPGTAASRMVRHHRKGSGTMRAHIVWCWLAVLTAGLGFLAGERYGRSSRQLTATQTNRGAPRAPSSHSSASATQRPADSHAGPIDAGLSGTSDGADNLGVTTGPVPPIAVLLDGGLDVDVTTPLAESPSSPYPSPISSGSSSMVEGTVLDVLGRPVPDAQVFVWISDKPQPVARSTYDGTFRAWVSHTGVVEFAASHPGVGEGTSAPVRLFSGQPRQGVVVRLDGRQ